MAIDTTLFSEIARDYRRAAEWEEHKAVWLGWPWNENEWGRYLAGAQRELIRFCEAITHRDPSTHKARGEKIIMLVHDESSLTQAKAALQHLKDNIQFEIFPIGDIWLRDTSALFLDHRNNANKQLAACFSFNGWGSKYIIGQDTAVAQHISSLSGLDSISVPFVLEGGSIESNGEDCCLTSRQCLLNPNRNAGMSEKEVESLLKESLAFRKILWLDEGLAGDHTDGHIDNLARFINANTILCMDPSGQDDPNASVLGAIKARLKSFTDAQGKAFEVVSIPSPGLVLDAQGQAIPASYMNFYIANSSIIVPAFGKDNDDIARMALQDFFPDRQVFSLPAMDLLSGGGSFHCISQQQ
ncbi:MAG: agmatine deiminase family protein [Myxococcales bacterium]|nr:MAG: agmatine deiminase family protein [Myxococcales bacterium]